LATELASNIELMASVSAIDRLKFALEFLFDYGRSVDISIVVADKFRINISGDNSIVNGDDSSLEIITKIVEACQAEESLTRDISARDLAYHLIRLLTAHRLLLTESTFELKGRIWRLFYKGAGAWTG
jgi:hypothetical protein